ncbi:hypothetical protein U1Q18_007452, partial [Sarracenia purpurea var. burkii]
KLSQTRPKAHQSKQPKLLSTSREFGKERKVGNEGSWFGEDLKERKRRKKGRWRPSLPPPFFVGARRQSHRRGKDTNKRGRRRKGRRKKCGLSQPPLTPVNHHAREGKRESIVMRDKEEIDSNNHGNQHQCANRAVVVRASHHPPNLGFDFGSIWLQLR